MFIKIVSIDFNEEFFWDIIKIPKNPIATTRWVIDYLTCYDVLKYMNIFIEYNENLSPPFIITMNMQRDYDDDLINIKNLTNLPLELIKKIISYLDYYSMLSFLLTHKNWNNIRNNIKINHNTRKTLREQSFLHQHNYKLCVKTTFKKK